MNIAHINALNCLHYPQDKVQVLSESCKRWSHASLPHKIHFKGLSVQTTIDEHLETNLKTEQKFTR